MPLNDALTAFPDGDGGLGGQTDRTRARRRRYASLTAGLAELFGSGPEMARVEDHTIPVEGGNDRRTRARSDRDAAWRLHLLPRRRMGHRRQRRRVRHARTQARRPHGLRSRPRRLPAGPRAPVSRSPSTTRTRHWSGSPRTLADIAGATVPIIVAGDSAGGNLAAVVAQRSRDRGGPPIAFQALIYPVTDADLDNGSYTADGEPADARRDPAWSGSGTTTCPMSSGAPRPTHRRCGRRPAGLPPAIVLTAEYDVLRDEGEAYADRLAGGRRRRRPHRHVPVRCTASSRC